MADKSFEQLCAELEAATKAHQDAADAASRYRSEETAALNRLNAAQRALSDAFTELQKKAPRDSDWKRQHIRAVYVAA